MATNSSSLRFADPRQNPALRGFERISPALSLDLTVGFDSEGWPEFRCFSVGDIVVSANGNLYKIAGFSLDNAVFVTPHGLGLHRAILAVEFKPEGLAHLPKEAYTPFHKNGLVGFG